jgi:hypothetical protein
MTPNQWILVTATSVCCFAGCKEKPADKPPVKISTAQVLSEPVTSVTGTWTGFFKHDSLDVVQHKDGTLAVAMPNKITLFIDNLQNGNITGHSICAGNDRPYSGIYVEDGDKIKATLKEPGSDKNDGTFDLVISKNDHTLTGKWTPFDHTNGGRHYNLVRKNFKYDPSQGLYPEASTRLLTSADVNNLVKDDLRVMRNEVYARHGYCFKLREVRQMFEGYDWYMPVSTDVRMKLTAIEQKNEKLIKQFEKYAAESYDDFGR